MRDVEDEDPELRLDVSALLGVPSRDEIKAGIPDQERFRPEPRLIARPQYRATEDGAWEAWNKTRGSWVRVHRIYVELYRGLEEGLSFEEIAERAFPYFDQADNRRLCARYLRGHVWEMVIGGYVELPLPAPPDVFGGRYRRVKELGRGGMGIAHLCHDEKDGDREVVVKHAWGWHKPIHRAEGSIRREAAVMVRFDHPRIVKLRDSFEEGGLLHIVRDYAKGRPMQGWLRETRDARPDQRLRLGLHIAQAVGHMHERGFLFLDPKPDNYIVTDLDAAPLVLDVGICRPHVDGVSPLTTPIGSAGYAAPEVIDERVATLRTDVWGVGRAMSAFALGQRTRGRWSSAALVSELTSVGVSGAELKVLTAMTRDDPQDRLPDMGAVVARLRGALGEA